MKTHDWLNIGSLVLAVVVIGWMLTTPVPIVASDETPTVTLATDTATPTSTYADTITPPPSLTPTSTITPTITVTPTLTVTPIVTSTLTPTLSLPVGYQLIDRREDNGQLELTIVMPATGTLATFKEVAKRDSRTTRINLCSRLANPYQREEYGDPVVCIISLWYNLPDED